MHMKATAKSQNLYMCKQKHTRIRHTRSDLNLKFWARINGSDALYVEIVMSTCCPRFLHLCLLFFINYAILRLNVLNALCDNRRVQPRHRVTRTSDNNAGFPHERVPSPISLPCIIYWPLLMFAPFSVSLSSPIMRLVYDANSQCFTHKIQRNWLIHGKSWEKKKATKNLWIKRFFILENHHTKERTMCKVHEKAANQSMIVKLYSFTVQCRWTQKSFCSPHQSNDGE